MIPVIEVSAYLHAARREEDQAGLAAARAGLAAEIRDALETVGFMVIAGHDVPQGIIDGAFEQARRFHALPLERKMSMAMNERWSSRMSNA